MRTYRIGNYDKGPDVRKIQHDWHAVYTHLLHISPTKNDFNVKYYQIWKLTKYDTQKRFTCTQNTR